MSFDAAPSDMPLETAAFPAHDAHAHKAPSGRPLWIVLGALIAVLAGLIAGFGVQGVFFAALGMVPVMYALLIWVSKG